MIVEYSPVLKLSSYIVSLNFQLPEKDDSQLSHRIQTGCAWKERLLMKIKDCLWQHKIPWSKTGANKWWYKSLVSLTVCTRNSLANIACGSWFFTWPLPVPLLGTWTVSMRLREVIKKKTKLQTQLIKGLSLSVSDRCICTGGFCPAYKGIGAVFCPCFQLSPRLSGSVSAEHTNEMCSLQSNVWTSCVKIISQNNFFPSTK